MPAETIALIAFSTLVGVLIALIAFIFLRPDQTKHDAATETIWRALQRDVEDAQLALISYKESLDRKDAECEEREQRLVESFNKKERELMLVIARLYLKIDKLERTRRRGQTGKLDSVIELGVELFDIVHERLDEGELAELIFRMGFDEENLRGETKSTKTMSLIRHASNRSRITDLLEICKEVRPDIKWPEFTED